MSESNSLAVATTAPEEITPNAHDRAPETRRRRSSITKIVEAYALVGLLIVAVAFFSLWPETSDTFLSTANIQILVANQSVLGIIAMAALIPLIANEWDLSIGAIAGVASIFSAAAMSASQGVVVGILFGLGAGLAVGAANALLVTRLGVNGVITTLGMATVLDGVVNQKTGGLAINANIPQGVIDFGFKTVGGIPYVTLVMVGVALAVYYGLGHTPYGRYLYAIGSSASAATLVGIRSRVLIGSAFVISGLLAASGGILQVARQAGADPRVGAAFTLPALAAAFLSAAAIKPGKYNVGGAIVAIFFLATINNGLSLAGVPAYVSSYVNGCALIGGVGLAAFLGRRAARSRG
ncbi:ABC transporter permease [Nocardioides aromaticivorans]|uniref:ABC transporter permease n=1 Tax=Nocardioides aromaticivorans TaxID=200618 RepID=A0ABX7PG75_9ACTN|nr:ABC transporter permease [Nocardioides aromaticivorans]QSR24890.1 ABC transporter permease [Nocardioides aromaticivorans]